MSGGPPHHPHNRQVPATNPAWNHLQASLQVPNFFPRQPQLAHMSNEHSLPYQPTWHTPTTTDAMKMLPHAHMFNEMLKNESLFPKDCVDLSLTRNGNQNGELPTTPISLSVRDANKINSLPPSALDIQAVELTKCNSPISPSIMSASPSFKSLGSSRKSSSPGLKSGSPGLIPGMPPSPGLIPGMPPSPGIKGSRAHSPGMRTSPGLKCDSPGPKLDNFPLMKPMSPSVSASMLQLPQYSPIEVLKAQQKRANVRVDSILERLNPQPEKPALPEYRAEEYTDKTPQIVTDTLPLEKPVSVIVQPPGGSCDENSNSNSISNVPISSRDEDTVSTNSNEDSLDSNKSRRKRKPCKTIRVSKDDDRLEDKLSAICEGVESLPKEPEPQPEKDPISIVGEMLGEESKIPERRRSSDDLEELIPAKTRRKTSSESETIDNIAAMVQDCLKEKKMSESLVVVDKPKEPQIEPAKPISVSVIKTKEHVSSVSDPLTTLTSTLTSSCSTIVTPAQKKATNTHFVEVENKLEEMFAGIEDCSDPLKTDALDLDDSKFDDSLSKLDDSLLPKNQEEIEPPKEEVKPEETSIDIPQQQESVTVSSTSEVTKKKPASPKKSKRKAPSSKGSDAETTPKKKKPTKKARSDAKTKTKTKKATLQKTPNKVEVVKDVYAYDSGSNASSSKSRGPYIQIKGPRDSPMSVNVVNTPINDEDGDRKPSKSKKFHDDSEYRHKVRSKGLHSSTLSNKYDAQTKDTTWICVFCKRGPHASELSGPTSDGDVIPPGDLFGPYFITNECLEFERRLDDPFDRQFKSKKITRCLNEPGGFLPKSPPLKKSKKKNSDTEITNENGDIFLGIVETDQKTYEIWAHEDCIVWSPGVYLVGHKIVGLEEAVWTSCNVTCKSCNLKGANIFCLRRACMNMMHLCCARDNRWQFDSSTFKAYCPQHAVP